MPALQYTIIEQDITNYANYDNTSSQIAGLQAKFGSDLVTKRLFIAIDPLTDNTVLNPDEAYT